MDADDISLPTRFEEQLSFMENNSEIAVCGALAKVFGENYKSRLLHHPEFDSEIKVKLLFSVCFAHPTVMIRKKVLDEFEILYSEGYDGLEDYKMWFDLSKVTKFYNIQKVLLNYRYLETSVTRLENSKKDDKRFNISKKIFEEVLSTLNIENNVEEMKLHFKLAFIERIAKEKIDLDNLDRYLNKLIKSNEKVQYFEPKSFRRFILKKYYIVLFFQIKQKNFLNILKVFESKLFYKGLINILMGKLK